MSGWNKTYIEGRAMWERCDGTRLESSEQIQALENYEKEQYDNMRSNRTQYQEPIETTNEYEQSQWEKDHPFLSTFLPFILLGTIYGISWILDMIK